jgi:hypothetical protein
MYQRQQQKDHCPLAAMLKRRWQLMRQLQEQQAIWPSRREGQNELNPLPKNRERLQAQAPNAQKERQAR